MHMTRYLSFCVALAMMAATAVAWAADSASDAQEDEQQLIAVLTSADSPPADKAITCKKLAIFGSKDAVPALAPLLNDEQLISWARIALEAIPGPEADEVLRTAMGTLEGRSLIGVINSLAVRGDTKAVPGLIEHLKDDDADVAAAAAAALGKIGGEAAAETLRQSLAIEPEAVRSAVAEGCVLIAEGLLAEGKAS
jgi:HEAT repeat protein